MVHDHYNESTGQHPMRTIVENIGKPVSEAAAPVLQESSPADWESTNGGYGFHGTLDIGGFRNHFFALAAKAVAEDLGIEPAKAVWVLDSRWGRHFCDQVNGYLERRHEWWKDDRAFVETVKRTLATLDVVGFKECVSLWFSQLSQFGQPSPNDLRSTHLVCKEY